MDITAVLATYPHRLPPFPQQQAALERSLPKRVFGLFMEQGTGKTKVVIDTTAIHYLKGTINALLVLAPNDVHEQWVVEQLPEHLPTMIRLRARVWQSSRSKAVRECNELVTHPLPGVLTVLAMNHEALATAKGEKMATRFLKAYRALIALDESDLAIKSHKAARTRALVNRVGPLGVMRRILTGTPAEKPFDLFAQINFLDERIHGYDSFIAFKNRYATWTKEFVRAAKPNAQGMRPLVSYDVLAGYQNLEELQERISPYIYQVRKADCLNLPPKVYGRRRVSLTDTQRQVYGELKENGLLLLRQAEEHEGQRRPVQVQPLFDLTEDELVQRSQDKDRRTTVAIKLTLLLRLQQCVGGFITDDNGTTRAIDGAPPNPRMQATLDLVEKALLGDAKVIVWALFRAELSDLKDRIRALQLPGVEVIALYGGTHSKAERSAAIARFKDPNSSLRVLIAHEQSLGVGMNFTVCQTMIYYSCGASGRRRMQSEDRAHRIGQKGTVNIYDLDAHEVPIDARMRSFRQEKMDFNAAVMAWTAEQLKEIL